eukprot:15477487-Alexandrium_andersonii.AAC.1
MDSRHAKPLSRMDGRHVKPLSSCASGVAVDPAYFYPSPPLAVSRHCEACKDVQNLLTEKLGRALLTR